MSQPTIPPVVPKLVKPTLDTLLYIDYDWWERQELQINVELANHLCQEHQAVFAEHTETDHLDWVDEETGEVIQLSGLQHVLQMHCSKQTDYINDTLSLVDVVFRVFLANGNKALTCRELSDITGRPAPKILQTLAGHQIYKGIRPTKE